MCRALWLGLKGGIIGLMFAIPTLMAINYFAERMQMGVVSESGLHLYHYITIGILPFVVAFIAMFTARTTVLRTLARMP